MNTTGVWNCQWHSRARQHVRVRAAHVSTVAAMAAGTVTEFAPVRPSLTDLYRDVVADSEEVAQR